MKVKIIAWLFLWGVFSLTGSQDRLFGQDKWAIKIGGLKNDAGTSIILDAHNDLVLCGTTKSYGDEVDKIMLVKIDLNGEVKLQRVYQWESYGRAWNIEEALDGNYLITGEVRIKNVREEILLMKVNKSGEKLWEHYYGGYHTDQGFSSKPFNDGYITIGYTSSQEGTTRGNFYLINSDRNGNVIWENNFGTEFLDYGFSVLPDENRDLWLLGSAGGFFNPARADYTNHDSEILLIKTDSDGKEIFRKYFGGTLHDWGKDIIRSNDGGFYIIGSTQSSGAGSFDVYLLRIDNEGNKLWEKTYGDEDFEYGDAISMDSAGNLFLVGTKQIPGIDQGPDVYIIKTDKEGRVIWEQTLGGTGSDYGRDVICLPDSGVAIVGEIEDVEKNLKDIYVVKLDKNGQLMGIDTSAHSIENNLIRFFPNPVSDKANIEWKNNPPKGGYRLLVFSASGHLIKSEDHQDEKIIQIDLSDLPQGTYLYQIIYGGNKLSGKFSTK